MSRRALILKCFILPIPDLLALATERSVLEHLTPNVPGEGVHDLETSGANKMHFVQLAAVGIALCGFSMIAYVLHDTKNNPSAYKVVIGKETRPKNTLEKASESVMFWSIHLIVIAFPVALMGVHGKEILMVALACVVVCSDVHWANAEYGSWKHALDTVVALGTLALHVAWMWMFYPNCENLFVILSCMLGAAGCYAMGWQRHVTEHDIEGGMWCHLLFRLCASWAIIYVYALDIPELAWHTTAVSFFCIANSCYFLTCLLLWRCVKPASTLTEEQDSFACGKTKGYRYGSEVSSNLR